MPSVLRSSTARSESSPSSPSGVRGSMARAGIEAERPQRALAHECLDDRLASAPRVAWQHLLRAGRSGAARLGVPVVAPAPPRPAAASAQEWRARRGPGCAR